MSETNPFLVGLVGTGVTQSLSPALHMAEGAAQGLAYVFRAIDLSRLGLDVDRLPEILDWCDRLGYDAVTITHPCKQAVISHLDRVDPDADALGAVNTVLLTPEGRVGYNTDSTGFEAAFRIDMSAEPLRTVVQLGAGGAGVAVADALGRLGAEQLTIVDLDERRAEALASSLRERRRMNARSAPISRLADQIVGADGVVHCTPVGMHDHPGAPFDVRLLRPDLWVADIVYRPLETELLRAARAAGCITLSGGRMAVYQAVDAFRLVTGIQPNAERMMRHFCELTSAEVTAT